MQNQHTPGEPDVLFRGDWQTLVRRRVSGVGVWEYLAERDRGVCVLPFTRDGRLILVRQFCIPVGKPEIQLPSGMIEEIETDHEAAVRELAEETGYQPGSLSHLGQVAALAGLSAGMLQLYLATDCELVGEPQRDVFERFNGMEVVLLPESELFKDPDVLWQSFISHALALARARDLI